MELDDVMKTIRRIVASYDNSDIINELEWVDNTIESLGELVLKYDLEQE